MSRAAVIAVGAVSPLGRGRQAYDATAQAPLVAITRDEALVAAGAPRPFVARVADDALSAALGSSEDRATALLGTALEDVVAGLDAAMAGWRAKRIGVAIGTSSGGMGSAERFFDALERDDAVRPEDARAATYFAPFEVALARAGIAPHRSSQLVTACAASTWALGLGLAWLRRGAVDVVLAGGYDAETRFVRAGFDALRATSPHLPAPFRVGREGMALGEGAAVVALVRAEDTSANAKFFVSGFGASTDAVHVTAPDRTGAGLARAMRAAVADASVDADACVAVSAHATATPFNDAMEARAIADVVGAADPVVHPFKAQIGHTLGAAGVLETLSIGDALSAGVLPPAAGTGALDDDARVHLLDEAVACDPTRGFALKVSAAFGGVNVALVVEPGRARRVTTPNRPARAVGVVGHRSITDADAARVARVTGADRDAILRVDALSLLGLDAVAALVEQLGLDVASLSDAALVVGHGLATIDVNQRFWARIRERGPAAAEPRVFPPTSPNLVAGQIAIHFAIRGPSAAVCRGLDGGIEALEVAAELVAAGHAPRALVVAVDQVGAASTALLARGYPGVSLASGATAALIDASEGSPRVPLDGSVARTPGHAGLAAVLRALLRT